MSNIALIGSLIVAGLTIIGNMVVAVINKNKEFNQAVYNALIDAAYKEYEYVSNTAKELSEKRGGNLTLYPFAENLIFYIFFIKGLGKGRMTERRIKRFFKRKKEATELFYKYKDSYDIDRPNN